MNTSAPALTLQEPGNGRLEVFPLPLEEAVLEELLTEVFSQHWQEVQFGILIQGAVLEISPPCAPDLVRLLDGYLTVSFGATHFHVCIGKTRGSRRCPTSAQVAEQRKVSRAELYRHLNDGDEPISWGIRLFNGLDQQQLTIFLPNPFLTEEGRSLSPPDFTKLALWQYLRSKYLGMPERDEKDYLGKRFQHCCS